MTPKNRRISRVEWEHGDVLLPGDGKDDYIEFYQQFLGDHEEEWILLYKGGVEIARYSARYTKAIIWDVE